MCIPSSAKRVHALSKQCRVSGTTTAGKACALGASSSAPTLTNSPYAAVIGSKPLPPKRKGPWHPPPGAFNHPELPQFSNPGPGRYTPSTGLTKPRTNGTRFGSEDRFKYLGPQQPLEQTSAGMSGMYTPQAAASPGPGYLPKYELVHSASRISSFSVERRDTTGAPANAATNPGPGLYTPSEKLCSHRRDNTPGGAFLADDRQKYLGSVDADTGGVRISVSPGPLYKPADHLAKSRAPTVSFGGRGPGTMKKPPSLKMETPGPGSYEHAVTLADGAKESRNPRSSAASFGSTHRSEMGPPDSSHCFHGKVPVDMTNASGTTVSPGPAYNPSLAQVKVSNQQAIFGTSRRVHATQGILR